MPSDLGVSAWRMVSLGIIFLSLLGGAWIQSKVTLGADIGWLIRSVRLMFEGQRFGVDIFEPNLPVTWYLCMPAAWMVEYLGLGEVSAIRLWIWIVAGISLLVARACIIRSGDRSYVLLAEFSAAAVAACILVGASFGQREHLAFLLAAPYLFVVRLKSGGTTVESRNAAVAGVLAGIAFSIKPVFAAIPLIVELALFVFRRVQMRLIRPETLAMAVAGCVSFFGTIFLAPGYLAHVVPATYATYWAYDSPAHLLLAGYPVAVAVMLAWLVAAIADSRMLHALLVWLAAFGAWTVSYFFQRRGFDYHGFPAVACAFVISVSMLAMLVYYMRTTPGQLTSTTAVAWKRIKIVAGAALILITSPSLADGAYYWFRGSRENWQFSRTAMREEMIGFFGSLGVMQGRSVFVFSTNPFPAFPTLNYLDADWVGPDIAQYLLPAWLRKKEVRDPERVQAIDAAMVIQREHVRQSIVEGKPDVILVSSRSRSGSIHGTGTARIDYFSIFGADPAVANALGRYRKVAEQRGFAVYLRQD
ncbi:MAG: hypothetical protein ACREVI_06015 [Steroidobacteraceae bacterium]